METVVGAIISLAIITSGLITGLQPHGPSYEDEYTPAQALQDTYSPQVTKNGIFLQATDNPQPAAGWQVLQESKQAKLEVR